MGFRSIAPVPGNSFGGTRGALLWAAWAQRPYSGGFDVSGLIAPSASKDHPRGAIPRLS